MNLLWLTWKDTQHPRAGGAEIVNEELAKRLAKDGHTVIFLTSGFPGALHQEERDGFSIVRVGGRLSVYWQAYRYYRKHLKDWPDLVIDEVNTIPFFAKLYVKQKNILVIYQLCREIWFYQMFFPLNVIGYILEPLYIWLLRDRKVITISESTKSDLIRYGFKSENISIISVGIQIKPIANLENIEKFHQPTILSLGTIRPMKRTDHIVRAFEIAKKTIPNLQLIIAGTAEGKYGNRVIRMIHESPYTKDIIYMGKVDQAKKIELLRKVSLLAVTSMKEGWCLVVTEANSQGTPAVVYNTGGLRDSVRDGDTGLVCKDNSPHELASNIKIILEDQSFYKQLQKNALIWSEDINFDKSYSQLLTIFHHV